MSSAKVAAILSGLNELSMDWFHVYPLGLLHWYKGDYMGQVTELWLSLPGFAIKW